MHGKDDSMWQRLTGPRFQEQTTPGTAEPSWKPDDSPVAAPHLVSGLAMLPCPTACGQSGARWHAPLKTFVTCPFAALHFTLLHESLQVTDQMPVANH